MNPSINLLERLLTQGRQLVFMGRYVEARKRLDKLLALPDVPEHQRIEAHQLLGDIHLDSQCYRKARRHLVAAPVARQEANGQAVEFGKQQRVGGRAPGRGDLLPPELLKRR